MSQACLLESRPNSNLLNENFLSFFLKKEGAPVRLHSSSASSEFRCIRWVNKIQQTKLTRQLLCLALLAQQVAWQYISTDIYCITLSTWHFWWPNSVTQWEEGWSVRIKHRAAAFSPALFFFVWPKTERHHGASFHSSFHSLYKVRKLDLVCMCVHERGTKTQGPSSPCPAGAQRDWMTINWTRYRMCRIWPQRKDWNRHCRPASPGQLEGSWGWREGWGGSLWMSEPLWFS